MSRKKEEPGAYLTENLDVHLAKSEEGAGDVRPGTEKMILWADPATRTATSVCLVYLHGFTATRQELAPLCDQVAHKLRANLFYTRLRGHGQGDEALGAVTVENWLQDGVEAMTIAQALGKQVILVGTSTGAALATWLSAQSFWQDCLLAVVGISPNYRPRDWRTRILRWPGGGVLARWMIGPYRTWTPRNPRQAQFWTTRYPTKALLPMMDLVARVEKLDLSRMKTPFLLIHSPDDQVIDVSAVKARFSEITALYKKRVEIRGSDDPEQHVLAGDIISPNTTEEVARTILSFLDPLVRDTPEQNLPPKHA